MSRIVATQSDNGAVLQARTGDEVVIRLSEVPTTGFRWDIENAASNVTSLGSDFEPAAGAGMGGGGTRTFRFRAHSPGQALLSLRLRRAWEGDRGATERYLITIQIS